MTSSCGPGEAAHTPKQVPPIVWVAPQPYDGEHIRQTTPLAVEARRQRFPHEVPYAYQPLANTPVAWNDAGRRDVLHHYQRRMIGI